MDGPRALAWHFHGLNACKWKKQRILQEYRPSCVWFVRMWVLSVALAAGAVCFAASSSPKKTIHKGQEKRWQLVLLDSRYTQDIVFLVGYKRRPSRRPFTTIRFFFAVVSSSLQTNTYLQKHFVKKLFLASLVTKGHFCDSPLCNIESYFSFFLLSTSGHQLNSLLLAIHNHGSL